MRTKTAALALAAQIGIVLDAELADLDPVATIDHEAAAAALASDSQLAVLVQAPILTFTTWTALDARFQVHVIAGQPGDLLAAWDLLDDALAVLVPELNPDEVEPASFANPAGPDWPALTLTLTQPHDF